MSAISRCGLCFEMIRLFPKRINCSVGSTIEPVYADFISVSSLTKLGVEPICTIPDICCCPFEADNEEEEEEAAAAVEGFNGGCICELDKRGFGGSKVSADDGGGGNPCETGDVCEESDVWELIDGGRGSVSIEAQPVGRLCCCCCCCCCNWVC